VPAAPHKGRSVGPPVGGRECHAAAAAPVTDRPGRRMILAATARPPGITRDPPDGRPSPPDGGRDADAPAPAVSAALDSGAAGVERPADRDPDGSRRRVRADGGTPAFDPESAPALQAIAGSIADGVVTVDEAGTVVYANEGLAALTGYDRATLVGAPLTRIMPERFQTAHEAGFERYLATGERTIDWDGVELAVERADGTELPVEVSFGEFTEGGARYFTGAVRDISDRRARERALETTERQFEALFEHPSSFAALLDAEGRLRRANEPALSFAGVAEDDVRGEPFWETPWWDDGVTDTEIRRKVERALAGESVSFEAEHVAPDGERVVVDGLLEPVVGPDGAVESVIAVGRDATGRAEATERLRADRRSLRRLYEVMADADPGERVDRLLELGCDRLDLPYGFLTDIDAGTQRIVAATGDHPELAPGGAAPLSESYCRRTVESDGLVVLEDAPAVMGADDPAVERFELGCYVGGKLVVDGELYGTLCFAGDASRELAFDDGDRTFVRLMVEWLARELEREAYEGDLEAARERLRNMLERIDEAFIAVDEAWTLTFANEAGVEAIRSATEQELGGELVGHNLWALVPELVGTRFYYEYRAAMHTGESTTLEERYEPLDAWFEVAVYPDDGGISLFLHDVTDRKRRERMLTGLLETTRELMAAERRSAVPPVVIDAAVDLLDVAHGTVRLHDPATDALVVAATTGQDGDAVPPRPDYGPDDDVPARRAFDAGEIRETADLEGLDAGPIASATYLPLGEYGVLTLATTDPSGLGDVERRGAELLAANAAAALDRAERREQLLEYEAVMENVEGMVFVADGDDRFTMVTEPLAERLGADRGALAGRPVEDAVAPDDVPTHGRTVQAMVSGYTRTGRYEGRWLDGDGEPLPVRVELSVLPGGHRGGYVGVVQDISALAETRRELASLSDRFGYLFENIPDPVNEVEFVDGEPLVRAVNPAFEDVFGYDFETVEGENLNEFVVPDDERAAARRIDARTMAGDVVTREVRRETADGLRTFLFRGVTYEVDGAVRGFGIYTDVTEQQERGRRLEVLHTVLRHNLRTEMTLVQGYAEMLAEEFDDPPAVLADLVERVDEVLAISDKVRRVERTVERSDRWERGPTDVVAVVEAAAADLRGAVPGADVTVDAPATATALADERLAVLVAELLENAAEHADDGPPTVRASVRTLEDAVELRVADDGPGIPEHERALVTGERDITQLEHGAGLGLWLVAWLVSAYGGRLSFEDREPRGSVVVVRLPTPD